jgi:hypothetical protein
MRLYGGIVDRMLPQQLQASIGNCDRIVNCLSWMLAAMTQNNQPFNASVNQFGL